MSFADQNPYTSFTTSNQLTSGSTSILPVNYNNFTRIRVSWSNNAGIKAYENSSLPPLSNTNSAALFLNKTVSFSLFATLDYSAVVTGGGSGGGNSDYYTFWDYMQIGIAMVGVFLASSIGFAIRRYIEERRRNELSILNGGTLSTPVVRPIPLLYRFKIDTGNNQRGENIPLSREEFKTSMSNSDHTLAATTILVVMPSDSISYLNQGLLPPCSFGTHISSSSSSAAGPSKSKNSRTKGLMEMIPMRVIRSAAFSPISAQPLSQ